MGDLVGVRLPSTQGDNSMALLVSLKTGRLGESPANLSIVPGSLLKRWALSCNPWSLTLSLVVQLRWLAASTLAIRHRDWTESGKQKDGTSHGGGSALRSSMLR